MLNDKFVSAIFCAPTGEYENYPSRLTDEVFAALKNMGINRIFGYGFDSRAETVERTFELCEKYGILYYPTPSTCGRYVCLTGDKAYWKLSETECKQLDDDFVAEVAALAKHKAFGGIMFGDEAGYLAFDGAAHACNVFKAHFAEYEFMYNFFSYSIDEKIFWTGIESAPTECAELQPKPFELTGDLQVSFANRFRVYDKLLTGFLDKAVPSYVSQDRYPMEPHWAEVPTSVHVALFELSAVMSQAKRKYGMGSYNYVQVGQWGNDIRRMTNKGELLLQINVILSYGNDGVAFFPGAFPLDWRNIPSYNAAKNGESSLIDIYGNVTRFGKWLADTLPFYDAIAAEMRASNFVGVSAYGHYDNGFILDKVASLPDSECIYQGNFPDMCYARDENIVVNSTNQVAVSLFEHDDKRRYFVTNLSSVYGNKVELTLPESNYVATLQDGTTMEFNGKIRVDFAAGEAMWIVSKK